MWVIDASAAGELLLSTDRGSAVAELIQDRRLFAPQLLVAELASLLRGLVLGGHLTDARAAGALQDFRDLDVELVDLLPLLSPAWELRHNISSYDAMYVVLAEALGCKVLTFDSRLEKASGLCVVPIADEAGS